MQGGWARGREDDGFEHEDQLIEVAGVPWFFERGDDAFERGDSAG
jgi:hypothetical protein